MENFRRGTISVTEMNTAQTEKDEANQTYVSAMAAFWNYYYSPFCHETISASADLHRP